MIEYIDLKIDFTNRNASVGGITLDRVTTRNYDTAIRFRIEIIGHTLDDAYDVKILSKHHKSRLNVMTTLGDRLEIVDGKLIYTPKVNLITEADYVRNYLYLSKDGLGLDMAQFNYKVDVSQIGEITLDIRQAYDESYETLIAEFEQALEDYKLTLPQASELRAEIDVILNQFGVDGQAKLSQYDDDAQQVIADSQTAFDLAETGRQNTYEQAETDRNQASVQAVVDWERDADGLVDSKLIEMQTNASTLVNGAIDDFNMRGDAEIADWRGNADGELEEYLADRVSLLNILDNGDFSSGTTGFGAVRGDLQAGSGTVFFTPTDTVSRIKRQDDVNINHVYYHAMRAKATGSTPSIYPTGPTGASQSIKGTGEWEMVSVNHKPTVSNTEIRYVYNGAIGVPIEVDWIIRIDLTETFGAGNEPTKAEMDELIKITGYFDEISLTQKQLLNWQLKLMRQNRNALIALGGTII